MLFSAFVLGLISSLHCIGMCGPIAVMLPLDHKNPNRKVFQIITYHLGRIFTYSTIGLIFGIVGTGFYLAGLQQQLSIFAGIAIILLVIIPEKTLAKYNFSKPLYRLIAAIKSTLGKQFRKSSYQSLATIGMLNGLLPCGMVYAAVFGALAMQQIGWSVAYMALFGLGTVPLMTTVIYLQRFTTIPIRARIQKIIPYAMVCIGILFIMRGLGLGIPYISPDNASLFVKAMPNCR